MKKIKTIIAGTIVLGHCCIKGAIVLGQIWQRCDVQLSGGHRPV